MELKALEILKDDLEYMCKSMMSNPNWQGETTDDIELYKEAISELEALKNRSCESCKYLSHREELVIYHCTPEICRTCKRNNNDNWESKC